MTNSSNVILTSSLVTPTGSGPPSPVEANLQLGERMATLDFTFITNEARAAVQNVSFSYDVACAYAQKCMSCTVGSS
ncbi:hypothetical protein B0H16DRAFT_1728511 [Mycena metata]|uniref:Uncharacterized protein n=1 Tax=Mycena metata TaxID=1033252 RepID=A0AAD7N0H3_9AGAR|nr:hypothetical protein B0H16DRAFT_1728511 [Mycena metata]